MKKLGIIISIAAFPGIIYAADVTDLLSLFNFMTQLINAFVPLLFGLAMLAFLWGMVKFIYYADDPKRRADGKYVMIWGVVALAVMMSMWGLALTLKNMFFSNSPAPINVSNNGHTQYDEPIDNNL